MQSKEEKTPGTKGVASSFGNWEYFWEKIINIYFMQSKELQTASQNRNLISCDL